MKEILRAAIVTLFATLVWGQIANAQNAATSSNLRFKNLEDFSKYVQSHHKAPFDRDSARLPIGGAAEILKHMGQRNAEPLAVTSGTHNVKINRDRDPWPKAEIARQAANGKRNRTLQ